MVQRGIEGIGSDNISVELLQVWDISCAGRRIGKRVGEIIYEGSGRVYMRYIIRNVPVPVVVPLEEMSCW